MRVQKAARFRFPVSGIFASSATKPIRQFPYHPDSARACGACLGAVRRARNVPAPLLPSPSVPSPSPEAARLSARKGAPVGQLTPRPMEEHLRSTHEYRSIPSARWAFKSELNFENSSAQRKSDISRQVTGTLAKIRVIATAALTANRAFRSAAHFPHRFSGVPPTIPTLLSVRYGGRDACATAYGRYAAADDAEHLLHFSRGRIADVPRCG